METAISEEIYLVSQAQKLRSTDPASAKAWLITAKTLHPTSFDILVSAKQ